MISLGIDTLQHDFEVLRGLRVGLVTNHTGRDRQGRLTVDIFRSSGAVHLGALFSPEHGLFGRAAAGEKVADSVEPESGLRVYSLYGETRRPTAAMLAGLEALVFDIQDVGARFYTYTTTLAYCLEACALSGIRFVVLDRPNPITGSVVEGPVVRADQRSFIGYLQVPIRHGLTIGELARWHQASADLKVDVEVVRLSGWERREWFDETGLVWEPPSPAMRSLATATLYPGTCWLEGTNVSEGRGTDTPFEIMGAPWIDEAGLADDLQQRGLPGLQVEPVEFSPTARDYADQICHGVRLQVTNRDIFQPVACGLHLLDAVHRQNPVDFRFERIARHVGYARVVEQLAAFAPVVEILEEWELEAARFQEERQPFLLYA